MPLGLSRQSALKPRLPVAGGQPAPGTGGLNPRTNPLSRTPDPGKALAERRDVAETRGVEQNVDFAAADRQQGIERGRANRTQALGFLNQIRPEDRDFRIDPSTGQSIITNNRSGQAIKALQAQSGGAGVEAKPVARVPLSRDIDASGARSAAFGRAKERVGDISQSALSGLNDVLGTRGFQDAGAGGAGGALREDVLSSGGRDLSEVVRDQALSDVDRSGAVEDRNLGAGLQQRSQDIGVNKFNASQKNQKDAQLQAIIASLF